MYTTEFEPWYVRSISSFATSSPPSPCRDSSHFRERSWATRVANSVVLLMSTFAFVTLAKGTCTGAPWWGGMSFWGSKMAKTREEKPVTRNCGITTKMFWMPYDYERISVHYSCRGRSLTRITPALALKLPPPSISSAVRFSYSPPFTRYSLPFSTPLVSDLLTCTWESTDILLRSSVPSTSSTFSSSLSDASFWMKVVLSSASTLQSMPVRGCPRFVRVSAKWMTVLSAFKVSVRIAVAS